MNSLAAFIQSRKTIAALFATLLIAVPILCGWSGWSAQQRQTAVTDAIYAVAGVWGIHMAATGYEDGQEKGAGGTTPPAAQVNVSSDVKNSAPVAPAAAEVPAPPPAEPPPFTAAQLQQIQSAAKAAVLSIVTAAQRAKQSGEAVMQAIPVQPSPPTIAQQDTVAGAAAVAPK